jgi:hypothetical protein
MTTTTTERDDAASHVLTDRERNAAADEVLGNLVGRDAQLALSGDLEQVEQARADEAEAREAERESEMYRAPVLHLPEQFRKREDGSLPYYDQPRNGDLGPPPALDPILPLHPEQVAQLERDQEDGGGGGPQAEQPATVDVKALGWNDLRAHARALGLKTGGTRKQVEARVKRHQKGS